MPIALEKADLRFRSEPVPRRATEKVVVHHTAGSPRQSVEGVHAYHLRRGWLGLGYNIVQDDAGVWYEGRGLDARGAHALAHNDTTVGVCLTGNFETDELPPHRYGSLVSMCAALCRRYGLSADDVVGHRELPGAATACPGRYLDVAQLRRDVAGRLGEGSPEGETIWRIVADGTQTGAYRSPLRAVVQAMARGAREITLERVAPTAPDRPTTLPA